MAFTIIIFLLVLSVLVFAHELGHFWTARRFGVKAEEFGFGFPPRAIGIYKNTAGKWKKIFGNKDAPDASDTIYSINWFPLGGFVKIKGENDKSEDSDSFNSKKIWQKSIILSAGVAMNIVLAALLISLGLMLGMPQSLDGISEKASVTDRQMQVVQVFPGSPASQAGVKPGDIILGINNNQFMNFSALQEFVDQHTGQELTYVLRRDGKQFEKKIVPKIIADSKKGVIGVTIVETGIVKYPWYSAIYEGAKTTILLTWAVIAAFYNLFKGLFLGHGLSADLAGPIGIASLTGQAARMGLVYLIQFTAMLSINLAIINFLPIPALDGGKVLFLIIEKIKGKPVKKELEAIIHNVGFALLIVLIVFVTFKDVARLDFIKILWQKIAGG